MPVVVEPYCTAPADSTVLWRYFSSLKYESLLATRSLYFSRPDKFVSDPTDSKVPRGERRRAGPSTLSDVELNGLLLQSGLGWTHDLADEEVRMKSAHSCWAMAGYELDSLWNYAGNRSQGIAVRTTWGHLKLALANSERRIAGGIVEYIDADTHVTPVGGTKRVPLGLQEGPRISGRP